MIAHLLVPLALACLAIAGFFYYPGHTFLESDSQIFMPVLLHRIDPSLYTHDLLAQRPHTAFTAWDELALAARRLTSLRLESLLLGMQIALRFLGLLGVFWLLEALLCDRALALCGSGIYGLGSWVFGPSLLTIEYEPVPRAFALPLVLLAIGLVARNRHLAAGLAGAAAFLFHPPTSLAFWAAYLLAVFLSSDPEEHRTGSRALALLPAAGALLLLLAWLEPNGGETQNFFTRIDPAWEKLQRLRAGYVFPSQWAVSDFWVYGCLAVFIALAYRTLARTVPPRVRIYLWLMPAMGVVSVPLTWLLLERLKWSLMPQLQPMRYTLNLVLLGILLAYAMGVLRALKEQRAGLAALWFLVALLIPLQPNHLLWLAPLIVAAELSPAGRPRVAAMSCAAAASLAVLLIRPFQFVAWAGPALRTLLMVSALSLLLVAFVYVCRWRPRAALGAAVAVLAVLFAVVPAIGRKASRNIRTPELLEVSSWAARETPRDTVFLFPDSERGLEPGVFRYYSRRNVFVDWKVGGQVNYLREFGEIWWDRWQAAMARPFQPARLPDYRKLGINYLVFKKAAAIPGAPVVFRNSLYSVVAVPH